MMYQNAIKKEMVSENWGRVLLSSKSNKLLKVELLITINDEVHSLFNKVVSPQHHCSSWSSLCHFNSSRISAVSYLQIAINIQSATGLSLSFKFELDKHTLDRWDSHSSLDLLTKEHSSHNKTVLH